jgi:hypothetical protein
MEERPSAALGGLRAACLLDLVIQARNAESLGPRGVPEQHHVQRLDQGHQLRRERTAERPDGVAIGGDGVLDDIRLGFVLLAVVRGVRAWRTPQRAWQLQGTAGLIGLVTVGPRSPAPLLLAALLALLEARSSARRSPPPAPPNRAPRIW